MFSYLTNFVNFDGLSGRTNANQPAIVERGNYLVRESMLALAIRRIQKQHRQIRIYSTPK